MNLNDNIHLINLKKILKDSFKEYNIEVLPQYEVEKFLKDKNLNINKHLECEDRTLWFKEKIESDNYSIYCFLYLKNEIVATISFSQYITLYEDEYEELLNKINVSTLDSINGNTLIVNPNFRNKGIAFKIKNLTNKYWFNFYDYIIGSTVNLNALNLYKKLGVIMSYSKIIENEIYYYYYYKKE